MAKKEKSIGTGYVGRPRPEQSQQQNVSQGEQSQQENTSQGGKK